MKKLLIALLLLTSSQVSAECKIFDATLFADKPVDTGMKQINMWTQGQTVPVDQKGRWVLNREDLPMDSIENIQVNGWQYAQTMNDFKLANPETKVGWYSLLPNRQYWIPDGWETVNDSMQPLADQIDYVYPSLYTFYDMQLYSDGWVDYAIANIKQARKYGKKVYPFLWFEYHDSNSSLAGTQIDAASWRLQLETVCKYADGVVIWGGWQRQFNTEDAWLIETRAFMERKLE